jgi:predicted dehydrogenase
MVARYKTVLIGAGQIGVGYVDDPLTAKYYTYSTHAQVLKAHPSFSWDAVVDPSDCALKKVKDNWNIKYLTNDVSSLLKQYNPEIAVIATPPDVRLEIIEQLPDLKAVIVEKPLGVNVDLAEKFIQRCNDLDIKVQVNLWRRADRRFRQLVAGELQSLIGRPIHVFGLYGNGLINNGTHMIDFCRMLFGNVMRIKSLKNVDICDNLPISGDLSVNFELEFNDEVTILMRAIDYSNYRENSLDIWGSKGRLSIMNEGISLLYYPLKENRAISHESEIASDSPIFLESTVGDALYCLYQNLIDSLERGDALCSSGVSALQTCQVVDRLCSGKVNA